MMNKCQGWKELEFELSLLKTKRRVIEDRPKEFNSAYQAVCGALEFFGFFQKMVTIMEGQAFLGFSQLRRTSNLFHKARQEKLSPVNRFLIPA